MGADELLLLCETRMYDIRGETVQDAHRIAREDIPWPKLDRNVLRQSLGACVDAARRAGVRLRLPRMNLGDLLDYYSGVELDLGRYVCRSAWYMQGVDCEGNVGSCGYGLVGNVRDATLAELWNGKEQRRFRRQCRARLFDCCAGCCFMEHRSEREAMSAPAATE
jgi:hypothetical protein